MRSTCVRFSRYLQVSSRLLDFKVCWPPARLVISMVYANLTTNRQHIRCNPCMQCCEFGDILEEKRTWKAPMKNRSYKKRTESHNTKSLQTFESLWFGLCLCLTSFGITIPSLHLACIHKHTILRTYTICCTNRIIIVWTLTFTIDVLQQTNRLIGFHRCQHANT